MTAPFDRALFPRLRPASVPELSDAVRIAAGAGEGVYPEGGGTLAAVGLPPLKPGTVVEMGGLHRIIDYPARDMTITAEAGVTVAALQEALGHEGQRLPIDVPHPDRATLGGILAANVSGPRRFGCGTLRDYCIGVKFVTDGGEEVKGGGQVVKNVAGYDLMKLQIGAWGTLGVVTQATLKVTPRPEDQAFVTFGVNAAAVGPTLDRLHQSSTRPVAVELMNAESAGRELADGASWVIAVGYEEKRTTIDWQLKTLRDELKAAPVRNLREYRGPEACAPLWERLAAQTEPTSARWTLKAGVPPGRLAAFVIHSAALPEGTRVHAHAGSGVLHLGFAGADWTAPKASALTAALTATAAGLGGWLAVRAAPAEWGGLAREPAASAEARLMRKVKQTLDPGNVFNPGRLFGDL